MASSTSYLLMRHFQFAPVGFSSGFFGGQAVSIKLGTKSPQFAYSEHIDVRSEPSEFSINPATVPIASGNITDLWLDMDQINSGVKYAAGNAGNIYQLDTSNNVTNIGNIGENGGAGIIYRADVDHIYITGQSYLSRIKRVSALTNDLQVQWVQYGQSSATSCNMSGGTNTYTLPSSINENSTNARYFTVDIEPAYQIGVRVIAAGTGNWTLTLHNDANDVLATVLINNNLIKNGQWLYFVFSSPIRLQRGNLVGTTAQGAALTYHFHLTSTTTDGQIATTTAGSISNCDMQYYAYPLVTPRNGLHPMLNFTNYTLIGNGNYMAQYEPLQDMPQLGIDLLPHRLTFPPGFEVCGFAQENLLCVIGTEKRSTSGQFQDGCLFFWDGVSSTYNDWWPVPEGAPESLYSSQNTVYFISGGALYYLKSNYTPVKLRSLPNTNSNYSNTDSVTHVYPHSMTVRRNILHYAYPGYTTSTALEYGIHSYGQSDTSYPLSFTFNDYSISTGSINYSNANNLQIGMIKNYGNTMYMSWQDNSNTPKYGVDIVNNNSSAAATAKIESLIFDGGGRVLYSKKSSILIATFLPLPANAQLRLKYKIDRESSWHYSDSVDKSQVATRGSTFFVMPIEKRFAELQYGADIVTGGNNVHVTSLNPLVDFQILERAVGGGTADG